MKRAIYNNGKVVANSGHALFDKNCDYIGVGNVISNAQNSSYIRAYYNTTCNGHFFRPGELQDADLLPFNLSTPPPPRHVIRAVKELALDRSVILYRFRSWTSPRQAATYHGYVVTDERHRLLRYFVTGPTSRSRRVILWCLPYVATEISVENYLSNECTIPQ